MYVLIDMLYIFTERGASARLDDDLRSRLLFPAWRPQGVRAVARKRVRAHAERNASIKRKLCA